MDLFNKVSVEELQEKVYVQELQIETANEKIVLLERNMKLLQETVKQLLIDREMNQDENDFKVSA